MTSRSELFNSKKSLAIEKGQKQHQPQISERTLFIPLDMLLIASYSGVANWKSIKSSCFVK